MLSFAFKDRLLNRFHWLKINTSYKRRNVEKDCDVFMRAAFKDILACPCGVYSREAFIRISTTTTTTTTILYLPTLHLGVIKTR